MVLLHKGCIIVSSERTVGTEFIVALPITNRTISQEKTSTDISSFDSKEFIEKQYIEYLPSEKQITILFPQNPRMQNYPHCLSWKTTENCKKH